jgi:LacI family transcriptional regulator
VDLREFANLLNLSITTVSRALAGYPDVSETTRARVFEAAQRHGYRPSIAARQMKTGRAEAIGLVLPAGSEIYGDPFFAELIPAIGAALARRNLDLVVTTPRRDEPEAEAFLRLHRNGRVDGLIVPRTLWDDSRIDMLIDRGIPFVSHGRTKRQAEHAWYDIDGEEAIRLVTQRLIAFGHRRIAFLNAPLDYSFARHRQDGFLAAMTEAGLDVDPAFISAVRVQGDESSRLAYQMLSGPVQPTAFVCATDRIAYGVLDAARRKGLLVPRDISITGYDDLMASVHQAPPLTTLRQSIPAEGEKLVAALLLRIAGTPAGKLQELGQAELVARLSDGPAPAIQITKASTTSGGINAGNKSTERAPIAGQTRENAG